MVRVWIDPNQNGSLYSNQNKIQTDDMEGGEVQFCLTSHLYIIYVELLSRCHLVGNMSICVTRESIGHHIALNRGHESIPESAC